jgi:signal-transduction protein with cAMP-binding, CBS, and nucleotidyltransferase domain
MWGSGVSLGPEGDRMEIREIIRRRDIELVDKDATVADAIRRMVDRGVGSVIVRRSNQNEAYGIVTRSDVLYKVVANGLDPEQVKVTEIMSSPVVILNNIELDVRFAAKAMANARVTNVVMFDKGDIYGFLSSTDIINAIAKDMVRKTLDERVHDVSGVC